MTSNMNKKPEKKQFTAGGRPKIRFVDNVIARQGDYIDAANDMIGADTIESDSQLQEDMVNNILVNSGANKSSAQINRYKSSMRKKAMLQKKSELFNERLIKKAEQEAEEEIERVRAEKNKLRNQKRRAKAKANKNK